MAELRITGNIQIGEALEAHARAKLGVPLEKFAGVLNDAQDVELHLKVEKRGVHDEEHSGQQTHRAEVTELNCGGLGWGHEEARRLAAALEHATAQGALKALERLVLEDNDIGDEGARHLADALARGAAPALKSLELDDTVIDAAKPALRDARPRLVIR